MTEQETLSASAVKVSTDLSAIVKMGTHLQSQAISASTHREMPGGDAMAALGHVANLEAWAHLQDAAEEAYYAGRRTQFPETVHELDERAVPALQMLLFWSEDLRRVHDQELNDRRPTLASEANLIKHFLTWIWDNEVHWDDFRASITNARVQLENLLHEGDRSERGVPCMYDECGGVRLVRKLVPTRGEDGEKAWVHSDWHCPRCKRTWDDERYWANVNAANERAKAEDIEGELWCTVDYAERKVGRSAKTIRTWINRSEIAVACIVRGRRTQFVCLDEVRERHETARARTRVRETTTV